jgi:hypothetical protein
MDHKKNHNVLKESSLCKTVKKNLIMSADAVISEVAKGGVELKHAETVDKSAPKIEPDVHLKTVDRKPFLEEVAKDHSLKHVDSTADRSEPKIDAGVTVKKNEHGALLAEVQAKAGEKTKE